MEAHALHVRLRAIELYGQGSKMTKISEELGVCYDTVRQWVKRYESGGQSALAVRYDRCGRLEQTATFIKEEILGLKKEHPQWGAAFIRHQVRERFPQIHLPQVRRLQQWFKAAGLQKQKTRLPQTKVAWAGRPFERVQVDAKERLKTKDGTDCCYLTFTDEHTGSVLDAFVFPPRTDL
jgi:transposase